MNQVDRSLLVIFSAEQAEHVSRIRGLLDSLAAGDAEREAAVQTSIVDELLRRMHTLKGAARAVGLEATEKLTHQAEEVLSRVREGLVAFADPARRALDRALDVIEDILAAAVADRTQPDVSEVGKELAQIAQRSGSNEPADLPSASESPRVDSPAPADAPTELIRVNAGRLDDLIRDSSELLKDAAAEAAESRAGAHASHLDDVAKEWQRLRRASAAAARALGREPEFHPIAECLSFIDGRLTALNREARALSGSSQSTGRALRERAGRVYRSACRIRMTPAEIALGGFGPMVRDLAQQEGKQIAYHSEGLETEADRLVLQGLKDPVMHLLRNAVSHGVEHPDERARAGKPAEGTIRLRLSSRGDRLSLRIDDDGRGLDYEAIRKAARERGLAGADDTEKDLEELARFVFHPGFSTSKTVSGVSGRGMGLSIVQRSVNRLRGEIDIRPAPGGGTRVALSVPISISTQHVLLLAAAGHTFGISAASVESLCRVKPSDIGNVDGRESIVTTTGPVTLAGLAVLLGFEAAPAPADEAAGISCVILNLNGRRAALAVDRLVDEREAIIKDSGLPEFAAGLTAGAIPMEDGSVAVMLNVNALFERFGRVRSSPTLPAVEQPRVKKARILVVDDSLTTRSLEKSILEAHGYQVHLAADGVDALEHLRAETPDLVISDVMMPRLTGFQLLERMKKDEMLKKIPVILVTSLESRDEQQMGLSLGADAYIVKKKFDQRELLNVIRQIL